MSTISASTTSTTAYKVTADTTGTLVLQTGASPTTAVTIGTNQVATFAQAPVLPAASIPQAALAAGVAGNGPAFFASAGSTTQTISVNTNVKVAFNNEMYDTNGNYDPNTNYRFTPTVAGYYFVAVCVYLQSTNNAQAVIANIFKNGSGTGNTSVSPASLYSYPYATTCGLIYCNGSTDYIEAYCQATGASGTLIVGGVSFQAFLARSA